MLKEIRGVIDRSSDTLIGDAVGAASLGLMLLIGLHLPVLF